jgi:hypothetical protein
MKFSRELQSTGRLAVRRDEDHGRPEHKQLKDTSLHKAAVCLQCGKTKCIGAERCFREEAAKRGK